MTPLEPGEDERRRREACAISETDLLLVRLICLPLPTSVRPRLLLHPSNVLAAVECAPRARRYADRIMFENRMKNQIDSDEYPGTTLIHNRLVSMIASLWHADDHKENATGCVTTGSSEAAQLGGLAMKKMWQARRKAEGKSTEKPRIIMGANAQVALEKFARYFDVEMVTVPVDESTKYVMDPKRAIELVDEVRPPAHRDPTLNDTDFIRLLAEHCQFARPYSLPVS